MKTGSFYMLLSFINVQLLAIIVGWLFILAQVSVTEDPADVGNSAFFLGYVLFAAFAILLILKVYKGKLLFYLLELGMVFVSFSIFFAIMPIEDLVIPGLASVSWALILGLAMVLLRILYPSYKNIFLLFATAIVGALLGASLDIFPAALLAMGLSIYDVIAVFYTKHMVTLAKELGDREAGFSITFPSDLKGKVIPKSKMMKYKAAYKKELIGAVELGTGDLAIPAMLVVSALHLSFWHSIAAMLGATFGISLLFFYIERKKGYWPALPPIVFFALLAMVLYHFSPIKLG
ncbi:MAG: presenilin family intramembrane aspartyl protease [Candidatus Micrarchaeota archaeon]